MTFAQFIELLKTIGAIFTPIAVVYVGVKLRGVHKQLNSMRDQENATNRQLGNAEGTAAEKEKQSQNKKSL